jgi:anti-repressor protein
LKLAIFHNELTMSSVEVAELTGKRHKHVLRDIENTLTQVEKDSPNLGHGFKPGDYVAGNGRRERCYHLTQDATILLMTGYSVPMRARLITRWRELENGLSLPNFNNPAEAARAWANEFEKRQEAEAQIERDRPKVVFAEAVRNMQGACSIGDLAKTLGTGRNRLFGKLKVDKVLMENRLPYQQFIDRGLFVVIEQIPYTDGAGKTHPAFKTLVTGVGQVWLEKKYRGEFRSSTEGA